VGWGVSIKEQKKGIFNALLYKKFPELYRHKIQAKESWDYYIIAVAFGCLLVGSRPAIKMVRDCIFNFLVSSYCKPHAKKMGGDCQDFSANRRDDYHFNCDSSVAVYWQIYGAIKYKTLFL
jgi:hypothetical protein